MKKRKKLAREFFQFDPGTDPLEPPRDPSLPGTPGVDPPAPGDAPTERPQNGEQDDPDGDSDSTDEECITVSSDEFYTYVSALSSSILEEKNKLIDENFDHKDCVTDETSQQLDNTITEFDDIINEAIANPSAVLNEIIECPKNIGELETAIYAWREEVFSSAVQAISRTINDTEPCCTVNGNEISNLIERIIVERFDIFVKHWQAQIRQLSIDPNPDISSRALNDSLVAARTEFSNAQTRYNNLRENPDSLLPGCFNSVEDLILSFVNEFAEFEVDQYYGLVQKITSEELDIGNRDELESFTVQAILTMVFAFAGFFVAGPGGAIAGGIIGSELTGRGIGSLLLGLLFDAPEASFNIFKRVESIVQEELADLIEEFEVEENLKDYLRELLEQAFPSDPNQEPSINPGDIPGLLLEEARRLIQPLFEQRFNDILEQINDCLGENPSVGTCLQNLEPTQFEIQYRPDQPVNWDQILDLGFTISDIIEGNVNPEVFFTSDVNVSDLANQQEEDEEEDDPVGEALALNTRFPIALESADCIGEACGVGGRLRYRVRVIQPGRSLNNYHYSSQMLERSANLLEGVPVQAYGFRQYQPMFSHLPQDYEPLQPNGFALNRVGILRDAAYESHPEFGDGLFATLIVDKAAEGWAKAILDEATTPGGNGTGVSIFADIDGDYDYDPATEDLYVNVHNIKRFRSVDLASSPAAGGAIVSALEDACLSERQRLEDLKWWILNLPAEEIMEARGWRTW